MTKYYVANRHIRTFEQNLDGENIIDCREGVLLDSYIGYTKDGYLIAAIETFETTQTSGLTIYQAETPEKSDPKIWDIWETFTANYDKEIENY